MFNFDIDLTDKACSIIKNVDKALVKKKMLTLVSKEIYITFMTLARIFT